MSYNLSSFAGAGAQFFDANGTPLAGGLLYTFNAGTSTPASTWTTTAGSANNTNPIVLDAAGRTPYEIWLNSGVNYKFVLKTADGTTIGTYDNIPSIDDPTAFNNLISVSGTNTLIGTSVPPYIAYTPGMTVSFIPAATNTGAVTIDLDGLGAKNVYYDQTTALSAGAIQSGKVITLEYDGTRFQLINSFVTAQIPDGVITPAKLSTGGPTWTSAGAVSVALATGSLGYSTGAGGAVTQATSRTTGVTLNKPTGAITLFTAAGSATAATFTVTNSLVAATDTVALSVKSGTNVYLTAVTAVAAGSFNVTFWTTGGTASDAPVINFAVIKGVAA